MKISKIETFLVRWGDLARPAEAASGSATAVVAIHADGMVGLGEASPMQGGVASLAVIARDMAPTLVGADALDHAVILDRLLHKLIKLGPDGIVTGALAAIDIALWDLKGKAFRQPICQDPRGMRDLAKRAVICIAEPAVDSHPASRVAERRSVVPERAGSDGV